MIDVYDLYLDFKSRVNTFQGGNFSLESDFIRNVNAIYFDIWDRETKNARKSQASKDNVIAFLQAKNIVIPNDNYQRYSILPLPKDYGRFSSARIVVQMKDENDITNAITIPDKSVDNGKCYYNRTAIGKTTKITPIVPASTEKYIIKEYKIELIEDNQWAGCLSHKTKFPTLSNPKMVQINGTFQIAPIGVSVVVFSYYTMPKPASINITYTEGDDQNGLGDEVIYNQSKSTQILLPINLKNEFLWRLGTIYGYFTRDQFMSMVANEKEKEVV